MLPGLRMQLSTCQSPVFDLFLSWIKKAGEENLNLILNLPRSLLLVEYIIALLENQHITNKKQW